MNNPAYLGSPELNPEKVRSFEVLWLGQWERTSFSAGYFESHYEDSIVTVILDSGLNQIQNSDQDPSRGLELEFSQELFSWAILRGSLTQFFTMPQQSYREAERMASLLADVQYGRFGANLMGTWHGRRESPSLNGGRIELEDYVVLNAKVRVAFHAQVESFVQVKNITNRQHLAPFSSATSSHGAPSRGAEALVGVQWDY